MSDDNNPKNTIPPVDTLEQRAMALFSAALEQPPPERTAWLQAQCASDLTLYARAASLLAADEGSGDVLRTGGGGEDLLDEAPAPERAGPYRITRLIGRGGMGAVYEGRRDAGDFDHKVAIKIIDPGVLSQTLNERFERERQILAQLNHPNIARLFDGGTLEDGSPYMVMEYVDGQPLLDFAEERSLALAARLDLFEDVCAAVRYTHQNLVAHRDVTPSNVLVTKDGQVKLIDFGISKPNVDAAGGAGEGLSDSGSASYSYTPGYAAPERSTGGGDNTLGDIFSLGKLLEALTILQKPGDDLYAIILKAKAHQPQARYPSVDRLLDDLGNYREGRAVAAREGGLRYELAKFLRRHRVAATASVLVLAALSGAFVVTLREYVRAEAALSEANTRFEQARSLGRVMIHEVYDAIATVPGTLEARQNMADIVKGHVDGLAASPNPPDDLLLDISIQYTRLSDLYGGLGLANFGDTKTSYDLLLRAETALSALLENSPENVQALDEMAWVKRLKANQQLTYQLDLDGARKTNQEGLAFAEKGADLPGAADTRIMARLWNSRLDRVKILMSSNALEEAIAASREYQAALETLSVSGSQINDLSRMAYLARLEGEALVDDGRREEAAPPLERALENYNKILETDNSKYFYNLQKVVTLMALARVDIHLKRGDRAMARSSEGVALARKITAADANNAAGKGYIASLLELSAEAQLLFGDKDRAGREARELVDLRRQALSEEPEVPGHRRDLAGGLKAAAFINGKLGAVGVACAQLDEARGLIQALAADETLNDFEQDRWLPEIDAARALYTCVSN